MNKLMQIKRHKNYDPFRQCMCVCMYLKTLCISRQNGTNPPCHSPSITTYTLLQRDSYAMYSYNIYNRWRLYPVLHPSSLIPRPSQKREMRSMERGQQPSTLQATPTRSWCTLSPALIQPNFALCIPILGVVHWHHSPPLAVFVSHIKHKEISGKPQGRYLHATVVG